jgi:hypothetical protein
VAAQPVITPQARPPHVPLYAQAHAAPAAAAMAAQAWPAHPQHPKQPQRSDPGQQAPRAPQPSARQQWHARAERAHARRGTPEPSLQQRTARQQMEDDPPMPVTINPTATYAAPHPGGTVERQTGPEGGDLAPAHTVAANTGAGEGAHDGGGGGSGGALWRHSSWHTAPGGHGAFYDKVEEGIADTSTCGYVGDGGYFNHPDATTTASRFGFDDPLTYDFAAAHRRFVSVAPPMLAPIAMAPARFVLRAGSGLPSPPR